jgi:hypothetical protein
MYNSPAMGLEQEIESALNKHFDSKEHGGQQAAMGQAAFEKSKGGPIPAEKPIVQISGTLSQQEDALHVAISKKQENKRTHADQN